MSDHTSAARGWKFSHYQIVDGHTGAVVARCKTSAGANRAVDKRDNEYGATRYYRRPMYIFEKDQTS